NGASSGMFTAEATTTTLNNEDGIASFSLAAKDQEKRDKAYLFIESKVPEVVKEKAENMVVVLPVHGQNNQKLSTIHLYPKNEENDYPDPPFEKVLEEPRNDFTIGEKITYSLHTTIPVNILDYQKLELTDSADEALTFLPNSLTISSNGEKLTEGFVIHKKPHGFDVLFSIPSLEKYAGKKLTISYQM
ncbi:pilin N-terminal domain-containing protein, partial [Enterococcus faecalis]|uniref:pilin N-terminal domain-containing protein n=1 Tax=Enterococcus faecalis TaxID=1351 RepID=UPI00403F17B7